MSLTSMSDRARMAEKLSIQQLQQSIQDGILPSYIGVPLLKSKVEDEKLLQQAKAAQAASQQPSVAQQIMSQADQVSQGVPSLQSNLPASMAGGGIVAFAEGGMYDEDETDEDRQDAERKAEMDELMNEYAQSFQSGIGSLPAAQEVAQPQAREGIASGDAADFVARIMHKESRGKRYDKDGKLLTSEKGAMGEMQVMPGTSRDPGYGVKGARDGSPDELARVGRDYANALLERYGDPKLAAIAYNMGPGATDKWLSAGADVSKLPKETQGYVKGFAQGGEVQHFATGNFVTDPMGNVVSDDSAPVDDDRTIMEKLGIFNPANRRALDASSKPVAAKPTPAATGKPAASTSAPTSASAKPEYDEDFMRRFDQAGANYMNERDAAASAPATEAAAKPDRYAKYEDIFNKREENLGKQREQDKYMALLQAGFGMMGGTSPNALANIGAGASQGIQSLAQSNKDRTAEENAILSGRLGLEKIGANREYQDAVMAYRNDLANKNDARVRELAAAAGVQKTEDRALREKKEYADQLESMRKDATTRMLANMKGQIIPGQEAVIEAKALESLKSDPDYIELFKKVYGRAPSGGKMDSGAMPNATTSRPPAIQSILDKYLSKG